MPSVCWRPLGTSHCSGGASRVKELQWRCQEGRSKVRAQFWQVKHLWDALS